MQPRILSVDAFDSSIEHNFKLAGGTSVEMHSSKMFAAFCHQVCTFQLGFRSAFVFWGAALKSKASAQSIDLLKN